MTIGIMIAPVLNTPRHPWYQQRYHNRIPKRGESKKYLDASFLASPLGRRRYSQPYPWLNFLTHAVINAWVEEEDLLVPAEWFQRTIAMKKQYLEEEYGA